MRQKSAAESTYVGSCLVKLHRTILYQCCLLLVTCVFPLLHACCCPHSAFQEALPELVRAIKYGKGPAVKVAAVDALVLACFVCAEDHSTTVEVMEHLQTLWKKGGCTAHAEGTQNVCWHFPTVWKAGCQ